MKKQNKGTMGYFHFSEGFYYITHKTQEKTRSNF